MLKSKVTLAACPREAGAENTISDALMGYAQEVDKDRLTPRTRKEKEFETENPPPTTVIALPTRISDAISFNF